jgi:hypothetical protein
MFRDTGRAERGHICGHLLDITTEPSFKPGRDGEDWSRRDKLRRRPTSFFDAPRLRLDHHDVLAWRDPYYGNVVYCYSGITRWQGRRVDGESQRRTIPPLNRYRGRSVSHWAKYCAAKLCDK